MSKKVISKLSNRINYRALKPEIKSGIFKSMYFQWDDLENAKDKIMDDLTQKVTAKLQDSEYLRHWSNDIKLNF